MLWKRAPAMPVFENNRDLLDRFRRGERSALAAVYEHYIDDVERLVRLGFTVTATDGPVTVSGAGTVDAQHDLLQEIFIKVFSPRARDGYDGLRPFRPYLMRIAQNVMIDHVRRVRRQPCEPVEDIEVALEASGQVAPPLDLGDSLDWSALSACAAEFMVTLDAEARQFVALRFEDDLSQDAVAERMGASRRRVRTLEERVSRGLEKFLRSQGLWRS